MMMMMIIIRWLIIWLLTYADFYFLDYTKYRESIALVQKIDLEILMKIHVLRHADSNKLIFGMSSVCLSICLWTP